MAARLPQDSWGFPFSKAHPELRLELINRIELSPSRLLAEVRMLGPGAADWVEEARRMPGVVEVLLHPEAERSALYRVTFATPSIHALTRQHGVLTRYPVVIQNGWSRFETLARPSQMRAFLDDLHARVGPGEIESVRRGPDPLKGLGLTPSLDAVFREALSTGYFSVPRAISLTQLARRLGRSKSTVSTALVRIQSRLADSAVQVDLAGFHPAR